MPPQRTTRSTRSNPQPWPPSPSAKPPPSSASTTTANPSSTSPSPSLNPLTYPYTPTEKGVLTIEPYKSALLPKWRFRTAAIARASSAELWAAFLAYDAPDSDDFVGMDMARKFIQMGMTRAKRYANYAGGRKYEPAAATATTGGEGADAEAGVEAKGARREKSKGHKGKEEKEEASLVFKEVWERCKVHEGYCRRKAEWMRETKRLKAEAKAEAKQTGGG